MGIEYELKFSATKAVQQKLQADLGGEWVSFAMRTTYFDTPDKALSGRKWTLRHRLENDRHVCTVKTPAGNARGEWEVEHSSVEQAIPELCKLGAPGELAILTEKGIVPVCGAAFTRFASTVESCGAVLEIALDSGILFSGDRQEPLCEVEVELKEGSREAADLFAAVLAGKYGLQRLTKSKFKRALALREEV